MESGGDVFRVIVALALLLSACGSRTTNLEMSSGDSDEPAAVADNSAPTSPPRTPELPTTTEPSLTEIVVNRVPHLEDIELPGLGAAGTIRRDGQCIILESEGMRYGLIVPEVTRVDIVGGAVLLSGPDGRTFAEGDMVFFGGLPGSGARAWVEMSEDAGLLNREDCPGPYAAWPYWSESCAIESYDDILDC